MGSEGMEFTDILEVMKECRRHRHEFNIPNKSFTETPCKELECYTGCIVYEYMERLEGSRSDLDIENMEWVRAHFEKEQVREIVDKFLDEYKKNQTNREEHREGTEDITDLDYWL